MRVREAYRDDAVTLYGGDALAVLAALPDACVDSVLTDPPYSSGGFTRADRVASTTTKYLTTDSSNRDRLEDFAGDNRDGRAWGYWTALWVAQCLRVVRPGGVFAMFTDWRQLPTASDALQAGGFIWRGLVPWHKPIARPQAGRMTAACEYVVWGSRGPMPVDLTAEVFPGFYTFNPPRNRDHITQKPVELMRAMVRATCPAGGVVLDPFMGSGTTGVGAVLEGRRFIGVEVVNQHLEVATTRLQVAQGQAVTRGDQGVLDWAGGVGGGVS